MLKGCGRQIISRNKRAVLDRLIIQRLLEPKLKPYLSRAELHMTDDKSLQELQVLIQQVLEAQTDNLEQLAAIAGLNLAEDLRRLT
jgi:transcriptional regulator GlxA family with amidase domain